MEKQFSQYYQDGTDESIGLTDSPMSITDGEATGKHQPALKNKCTRKNTKNSVYLADDR